MTPGAALIRTLGELDNLPDLIQGGARQILTAETCEAIAEIRRRESRLSRADLVIAQVARVVDADRDDELLAEELAALEQIVCRWRQLVDSEI